MAVSYTNVGLSSFTLGDADEANLTFSWIQELPGSGKRELAGDVARAGAEVADHSLEVIRRAIATRVKSLYAELHRIERTRLVFEESAQLLDRLVNSARTRYETGAGTLESVLKAGTERTRLDAELALLAQERREAEIDLASLLGRGDQDAFPPAVTAPIGLAVDPAALEAAALEESPTLTVLRATSRRDGLKTELARSQLKPDYMWGAAYGYRGDLDPMVQGMFGVRLPLFRQAKQSAAAAQADYEHQASLRDVESLERGVRAEVRGLLARVERAETVARLYDEAILPQARSALDAASAAFVSGRADFMTLIDDFLKLLQYEIELASQKAERVRFLASLELLTGEELVFPGDAVRAQGDPR